MSLTRRSLLRGAAATAASAGVLGALVGRSRVGAAWDDRERSVLLVVLPLVRADHVDAFEGGAPAKTPNLNDLTARCASTGHPESMPALSARARS